MLIAEQTENNALYLTSQAIRYSLVHVTPFPVNPVLHLHSKLPGVFAHIALSSQLSVISVHSSVSAKSNKMSVGSSKIAKKKRIKLNLPLL